MLRLALCFFIISLVAAVLGCTGIAAAAAEIARLLFFVAVVIFVVFLVAGLMFDSAFLQARACRRGFQPRARGFVQRTPDFLCSAHPLFASAAGIGAA